MVFDWSRLEQLEASARWTSGDLIADDRMLAAWNDLRVMYGPFNHGVTPSARVVLLGLTPGMTQLQRANDVARQIDREQITDPAAIAALRRAAIPFAGSMRSNANHMLDELGLRDALHIDSCSAFFEDRRELAHTASALHYPVFRFRNGGYKNYSGAADLAAIDVFREMLERLLLPQLQAMPEALIVPFGKSVESGVDYLISKGHIDTSRVLRGFPHPSGANGHRKRLFEEHRSSMSRQIREWFR